MKRPREENDVVSDDESEERLFSLVSSFRSDDALRLDILPEVFSYVSLPSSRLILQRFLAPDARTELLSDSLLTSGELRASRWWLRSRCSPTLRLQYPNVTQLHGGNVVVPLHPLPALRQLHLDDALYQQERKLLLLSRSLFYKEHEWILVGDDDDRRDEGRSETERDNRTTLLAETEAERDDVVRSDGPPPLQEGQQQEEEVGVPCLELLSLPSRMLELHHTVSFRGCWGQAIGTVQILNGVTLTLGSRLRRLWESSLPGAPRLLGSSKERAFAVNLTDALVFVLYDALRHSISTCFERPPLTAAIRLEELTVGGSPDCHGLTMVCDDMLRAWEPPTPPPPPPPPPAAPVTVPPLPADHRSDTTLASPTHTDQEAVARSSRKVWMMRECLVVKTLRFKVVSRELLRQLMLPTVRMMITAEGEDGLLPPSPLVNEEGWPYRLCLTELTALHVHVWNSPALMPWIWYFVLVTASHTLRTLVLTDAPVTALDDLWPLGPPLAREDLMEQVRQRLQLPRSLTDRMPEWDNGWCHNLQSLTLDFAAPVCVRNVVTKALKDLPCLRTLRVDAPFPSSCPLMGLTKEEEGAWDRTLSHRSLQSLHVSPIIIVEEPLLADVFGPRQFPQLRELRVTLIEEERGAARKDTVLRVPSQIVRLMWATHTRRSSACKDSTGGIVEIVLHPLLRGLEWSGTADRVVISGAGSPSLQVVIRQFVPPTDADEPQPQECVVCSLERCCGGPLFAQCRLSGVCLCQAHQQEHDSRIVFLNKSSSGDCVILVANPVTS